MIDFAQKMTDEELLSIVRAGDSLRLPFDRRYDGDTSALDDLLLRLEIKPSDVVTKLLVQGEVMREALARGLSISRSN